MLVSVRIADAHTVEAVIAGIGAIIVVAGRVSRLPACGGEV
jgi:hypothetical protein